jgi:hypothetical protein
MGALHMAFKEVLQIIPKLSTSDLNNMERSLQSRFTRIAKTFGSGLKSVLTGGSVLGAAAFLLQKALSPLKEIQEAIDRTLEKGSDLSVNAKQFGSTPGELAKLHAFGEAKGISSGELDVLITKFQTAVAEAIADPTKDTSVRQFTGEADTVKGFFNFIQGLQQLPKTSQLRVQTEVFGEKQILRMSEFLNADFPALVKAFSDIKTSALTRDIGKLDSIGDFQKQIQAHTSLRDLHNKAQVINQDQAAQMDQAEQARLKIENDRIKDFRGLVDVDTKMQNIQNELEKLTREVLPAFSVLATTAIDLLRQSVQGWKLIYDLLKDSRAIKGIMKFWGGN